MKIQLNLFILFIGLMLAVTSCQDKIDFTEDQPFRVEADFQKKLIITDQAGLNSITLGLSSNSEQALSEYTETSFSIIPLNASAFENIKMGRIVPAEGSTPTSEIVPSEIEEITVDESSDIHFEVLNKTLDKNVAALQIHVNENPELKARGSRSGCNWHYSWASVHKFIFMPSRRICTRYETTPNTRNNWRWHIGWFCSGFNEELIDYRNSLDWRARICSSPRSSTYSYIVE